MSTSSTRKVSRIQGGWASGPRNNTNNNSMNNNNKSITNNSNEKSSKTELETKVEDNSNVDTKSEEISESETPKFKYTAPSAFKKPTSDTGPSRPKEVILLQDGLVWLRNWMPMEIQKKIILHCIEFGEGKHEKVNGFYEGKLHAELGFWNVTKDEPTSTGLEDDLSKASISEKKELNMGTKARITIPIDLFDKTITDLCCIDWLGDAIKACPSIPDLETPSMVLFNYYTPKGKIGWHMDRVPGLSKEDNLKVTSPVVSLSLGDSAYFCYKNEMKDEEKSIFVESGDIVVFGGPSRMVFHTVPRVIGGTAPPEIGKIMKKYPGRFNLTFRAGKYFE